MLQVKKYNFKVQKLQNRCTSIQIPHFFGTAIADLLDLDNIYCKLATTFSYCGEIFVDIRYSWDEEVLCQKS